MSPARRLLLLPASSQSPSIICLAACRQYASMSRKQIARDVEISNRLINSRNKRDLSLSEMKKESQSSLFKGGDGPLFPRMSSPSSFSLDIPASVLLSWLGYCCCSAA